MTGKLREDMNKKYQCEKRKCFLSYTKKLFLPMFITLSDGFHFGIKNYSILIADKSFCVNLYKEYTSLKSRELEELPRFWVMGWKPF